MIYRRNHQRVKLESTSCTFGVQLTDAFFFFGAFFLGSNLLHVSFVPLLVGLGLSCVVSVCTGEEPPYTVVLMRFLVLFYYFFMCEILILSLVAASLVVTLALFGLFILGILPYHFLIIGFPTTTASSPYS